jgi:lipoyl-dependent peroxiredoxin
VKLSDDATVEAAVGIGPEDTSFGLVVTLTATVPGVDQAQADDLVEKAHQMCPYSKATRGNVEVTLVAKT